MNVSLIGVSGPIWSSQLCCRCEWSSISGLTNLSGRSLLYQLAPQLKCGKKLTILGLPLRAAPIDVDMV